jgi:iron complex transport system substrate-binding protein
VNKIVSLLPSATEIICGLGLQHQLVGVSHECDFPAGVEALPRVTRSFIAAELSSAEIDAEVRQRLQNERSLYSLDRTALQSLRPDLIVTQTLCDVCAVAESDVHSAVCTLPGDPQIVNLQPECLSDVFECIRQVGQAAEQPGLAEQYTAALRERIDRVTRRSDRMVERPRVLLLEWIDPPFSAGHWSPELVQLAGGDEAIGTPGQRSSTITWESIVAADPDVIVIACCGFTVERARRDLHILERRRDWKDLRCVRSGRVFLVDGSAYFNRPGPRLVDSLEILAHALDPEVHPLPAGLPQPHRV